MLGGSSAPRGGSRQWSPRRAGRWEEEGDCGTGAPSDRREVGLGGEASLPVGALQGAADTRFLRVFVPGKEGVLCVSLGKPKLEAGCPAFPECPVCPERRGAAEFPLPHRDVHFSGTQGVFCPARRGWWPFLPAHSSSRGPSQPRCYPPLSLLELAGPSFHFTWMPLGSLWVGPVLLILHTLLQ